MRIEHLRTNQLKNPIGYDFSFLTLSWLVIESSGKYNIAVQIEISEQEDMQALVYDSGRMKNYRKCSYYVSFQRKPRTRYYWRVYIKDDLGAEVISEIAWFETGKETENWIGRWIGTKEDSMRMPVLYKRFNLDQEVINGRCYALGVGLYEIYINGKKVGDEYLLPGYHSYDCVLEYQTYDLTEYLKPGENCIEAILGEGWYKGRFGFDGDYKDLYGNQKMLIAELYMEYADGSKDVIISDKLWQARESRIQNNNIYDGESIDDTLCCKELFVQEFLKSNELMSERTNPPLRKVQSFAPVFKTVHPDGYLLLDFGESITGWVEFEGSLRDNQKIELSYGELLQDGGFYNENLRTAKAQFTYVSAGENKRVRPHFTYYGFRYVKVTGLQDEQELSFTAYSIMSDIEVTGEIRTSNEKVNQLFANTLRSQKCNFLDIPTDCPQRDERMGWTGDAAIFVGTACFHMNSSAFFRHYAKSLFQEQRKLGGAIPFFTPLPKVPYSDETNPFYMTAGACAWGDVAAILPWTLYCYYGDKQLLKEQYPMMCQWVEYVTDRTMKNDVPYLWQNDRQLGDWLALDNGNLDNPVGKTDPGLLASAYYYLSVCLCLKAAEVLNDKNCDRLQTLKTNIRTSFLEFYFEGTQLKVEPTQTASAFLLTLGLYPFGGRENLVDTLKCLLRENDNKLNTGFIGTPSLCPALSKNNLNHMAYDLLLNEEYPGWLFEVNMGATTVWERWNSLNMDGTISGMGMNSMNHYAYGSIAEWMYRYMCGFKPTMDNDIKMEIEPNLDERIGEGVGKWKSVYGTYVCAWKYDAVIGQCCHITIPFNANAKILLCGNSYLLDSGTYYFVNGKLQEEIIKDSFRNEYPNSVEKRIELCYYKSSTTMNSSVRH